MSQTVHVAVVEDNEGVREALSELLEVMGFACREFESAEAFLTDYVPDLFACLITDMRMPGMNGAELQQQLRTMGCHVPVIVITSAPDAATRQRVLADGAEAYLSKPITDTVLLHHLESALRSRRPSQQDEDPRSNGG